MNDTASQDKTILLAVDESDNSRRALLYVADFLGGSPGYVVVVLSVLFIPEDDYFETRDDRNAWIEKKEKALSEMLERYRDILIQSGFDADHVKTELIKTAEEPVSSVILRKQEQVQACTLVIGRKGKSRHEEFIFGSVANKLVHGAHRCAVWVIEPVCATDHH